MERNVDLDFPRIERKEDHSTNPYVLSLRRLLRNPIGVISLIIIGVFFLVGVLGANIRPDSTKDANHQILQIEKQKPGFRATFLLIRKNEIEEEPPSFLSKLFFGYEKLNYIYLPIVPGKIKMYKNNLIVQLYRGEGESIEYDSINMADIVYPIDYTKPYSEQGDYVIFYTLNGEIISTQSSVLYEKILKENIVEKKYYLGTDTFGRDMLSRIMLGATVSLTIGFVSVFISIIIGVILGAVAGYFGGFVDEMIMFIINVFWAIPSLLLAIAISLIIGKGMWAVFIALGLSGWPEIARVVRGQTLVLRETDFIKAAKAMGIPPFRIIIFHLIPNCISSIIIFAASGLATAIISEAGLSFLGIGVQPPTPSWGKMIRDHYGYILTEHAYLAIIPGFFLCILVLAFTLLGYSLRDAFDIKGLQTKS